MRRRTFLATLPVAAAAATSRAAQDAGSPPSGRTTRERAARREPQPEAARRRDRRPDRPGPTSPAARRSGARTGRRRRPIRWRRLAAIDILQRRRLGGGRGDRGQRRAWASSSRSPAASAATVFVMLWDPKTEEGGGPERLGPQPAGADAGEQRERADGRPHLAATAPSRSACPARSTPGGACTSATASCRGRSLFDPAIRPVRGGRARAPDHRLVPRARHGRLPQARRSGIEEIENFKKVWAPGGRTPREGEVFRNPDLGRTTRLIAEGGARRLLRGRDRRRHRALLQADRRLDDQGRPRRPPAPNGSSRCVTNYRGVDV